MVSVQHAPLRASPRGQASRGGAAALVQQPLLSGASGAAVPDRVVVCDAAPEEVNVNSAMARRPPLARSSGSQVCTQVGSDAEACSGGRLLRNGGVQVKPQEAP